MFGECAHFDKKMIIYESINKDSNHINNTLEHSVTSSKKCSQVKTVAPSAGKTRVKKINKNNRKFLQSLGFKVI